MVSENLIIWTKDGIIVSIQIKTQTNIAVTIKVTHMTPRSAGASTRIKIIILII